ncbi:signal peptidase I [Arenicella chitinivorans]|uniref:Signal peptidase I n=1 Tax=Arenicella chitinivorans TaxID=1329800 RepID=A0A918RMA5_9GAMM|nr:signal peptidase I [Arenicella chitinivorans]GHA02033.1 signal peptidase I [Arenicella chitinivorans]
MHQTIRKIVRANRGLLIFLLLMSVFRSSFADWNTVPTGSMQPTIVEGDRILINKLAYDLQLPFVSTKLLTLGNPKRGDIVIFESLIANNRLVKRVIGLPGDRVALTNNQLIINGEAVTYETLGRAPMMTEQLEKLFGQTPHRIRTSTLKQARQSFAEVTVPKGRYLVLGDNRDNSADSRFIGFVPRREIIGRSRRVVMSLNREHYYLPRLDRFWQPI